MKSLLQKSYLLFIYSFLYIPIIVLILYSFNTARYSLLWQGGSTIWYKILAQDASIWSAFLNSVILGITASVTATVIGLLASLRLFLSQKRKKHQSFMAMLILFIVIPDLILGVSLLIFYNYTHIPLGFISLLISHITFCLPYTLLTIMSRIETLDINIYYSALDLGASHMRALNKVLLPLLFSSVLSALLLSFTLSFDDVVISYFVSGPEFTILPLAIYSMIRTGVTPELNALGTITLLVSLLFVFISMRLTRKSLS